MSGSEVVEIASQQPDAAAATAAILEAVRNRWAELWQGENASVAVLLLPSSAPPVDTTAAAPPPSRDSGSGVKPTSEGEAEGSGARSGGGTGKGRSSAKVAPAPPDPDSAGP